MEKLLERIQKRFNDSETDRIEYFKTIESIYAVCVDEHIYSDEERVNKIKELTLSAIVPF